MPRKRLSMRIIRETLRLRHEAKLSFRQIAASTGRSYGVVAKYLYAAQAAGIGWPVPEDLDEDELHRRLFPDAKPKDPSKVLPDMAAVHRELRRRHVTLRLLWEEYRADHPDGFGYTQFCEYFRRWSGKADVTMRQRHVAGEKSFVDWAGPTIPWIDPDTGEIRKACLFVAALGASNLTFGRACPKQELASWIDGHVKMFEFWGGVTSAVVPDNTRTAVTNANYYEPELHPTYQEMAEHYGVAILPTRVGRPRDKAKVENAVLQAERQILGPLRDRRFFSVGEINGAIEKLLVELNDRPFQKLAGSRRSWFEDLERPALRPLPPEPYEIADWRKAIVNLDYHVQVDWRFYSVPYRLVKQQVDAKLTGSTVQVFLKGKRVALHKLVAARGGYSTDPAHMPKAHLRYGQRTPRYLLERARTIGPACGQVAAWIIEHKPHPEQGYRSVLGILRLGRDFGEERLERACRRAQLYDCRSYRSIASILRAGLDREPLTQDAGSQAVSGHPNIRGKAYFRSSLPLELPEAGDDDVNGAFERSKSHA